MNNLRTSRLPNRNCFSSYPFTKLQKDCGDAPNIERGVSKTTLINEFNRLKNELGRIPTIKDIDEKGVYRSSYYRSRWGSIDRFLKDIDVPQAYFKQRTYQKKELILIYLFLQKALQIKNDDEKFYLNQSALEELKYMAKSFISPGTFSKRFGNWDGFLKSLTDENALRFIKDLNEIIERFLSNRSDASFSANNDD